MSYATSVPVAGPPNKALAAIVPATWLNPGVPIIEATMYPIVSPLLTRRLNTFLVVAVSAWASDALAMTVVNIGHY